MSNPLDEACDILNDFEKKIVTVQTIRQGVVELNPHFEQMSPENWQVRRHRMWLHMATNVWECNELERWLYGDPPATQIALSSAQDIYKAWEKWQKIAGIPKESMACTYDKKRGKYVEFVSKESSDTYYATNDKFDIEEPIKGEILLDYIIRQAQLVENNGKGDPLAWRALKCFINFLRKDYPTEQVAFVEHIFPQKMDLHFGRIIRLIPQEAYPIPEETAADILIELARRGRSGRPDARHAAIEGLALCWLCIATSRVRLPKTLEIVRGIGAMEVLSGAEFSISTVPTYGGVYFWRPLIDSDFSVLRVPTWFGPQPLKISNQLAAFLKAVSRIPSTQPRTTILQKPRRSLDRVLEETLKEVSPNPEYGNITYLSFLQQPHVFGDHRSHPKYKTFK